MIYCGTNVRRFRIPVQVSILSERRVYHPYGLAGGGEGECGLNIWVRRIETLNPRGSSKRPPGTALEDTSMCEERRINLGGKNTAAMKPGERIIIHTPGGGGWGKVGERVEGGCARKTDAKFAWLGGSYANREERALQA
jgi:5-oxoprolinase (ATP-hydrolysing)